MRAIVLSTALLSGCAELTLAGVHQSLPEIEKDHHSFEGIELGAKWRGERYFAEVDTIYIVNDYGANQSPWLSTVKVGIKLTKGE